MGLQVKVADSPVEGIFLRRLNRFNTLVEVEGFRVNAYLPNSGRLQELLQPGARVILKEEGKPGRKTFYTLIGAVTRGGVKVSVDSRVPNKLMAEALKQGKLSEFKDYRLIKAEPVYGKTRFDFLLGNGKGRMFMEVKSCTLAVRGAAMFPDAPTLRGQRHLKILTKAVGENFEAAIVFLAQRSDVRFFRPNEGEDAGFAEALREAALRGVKVYAYKAEFDGKTLRILSAIPVKLWEDHAQP